MLGHNVLGYKNVNLLSTKLTDMQINLSEVGKDGRTDGQDTLLLPMCLRTDALTNRHWPSLPVKENSNILISKY